MNSTVNGLFPCSICNKNFSFKCTLRRHEFMIHQKLKPHKCNICKKEFSLSQHLRRHLLLHQKGVNHECLVCGKGFFSILLLKDHSRIHNQEKPHRCQVCPQRFNKHSHLLRHHLTHTQEKAFECEQCFKKFQKKEQLQVHMVTHTGHMPFVCDICNKKFGYNWQLKSHCKRSRKHEKLILHSMKNNSILCNDVNTKKKGLKKKRIGKTLSKGYNLRYNSLMADVSQINNLTSFYDTRMSQGTENRSDIWLGMPFERTASVEWHNIRLMTNDGKSILKGISGAVNSGELMAIMGPSGAGKTALLNVLSGNILRNVTGSVLVDGMVRNIGMSKKSTCYILQEDYLLPYLTVRETVFLAAMLKLPSTVNRPMAADEVMYSLGLFNKRNCRASELSSGEKKRLCIAEELVSKPEITFLDEPTSGLDSSSCLQCIQLLKSLAKSGRTIILTIHQPNLRIFQTFDNMYMLANGQCIYRGNSSQLVPFFAAQGLICPPCYNPADFAIEVASGDHGDCIWKLKEAVDKLEFNHLHSVEIITTRNSSPFGRGCNKKLPVFRLLLEKINSAFNKKNSGLATSSWNQFRVLTYRNALCTLRHPVMTKLRFLATIIVGVLVGLLYSGIGNDAVNMYSSIGLMGFTTIFICFSAMLPTLLVFPLERTIFAREHLNHWYSTEMYTLSKIVAEIPFQIILPLIYSVIIYPMTSQPLELYRFTLFTFTMILTSLVSQAFGQILGSGSTVQQAIFLAPVFTAPKLLFSGFLIWLSKMPSHFLWISHLSYIRYTFQSIMISIYGFDRPELDCETIFCIYQEPSEILRDMGILEFNIFDCFNALWGFFLAFRIGTYLILLYRITYRV